MTKTALARGSDQQCFPRRTETGTVPQINVLNVHA